MITFHRLDERGEAIACDEFEFVGWIMQNPFFDVVVRQDSLGAIQVSTVFLPGPAIGGWCFETMVFGGPQHEHQQRYKTRDDAVAGHQRIVAQVLAYN